MERISLKQVNNGERFFRVPKQLFESSSYKRMSAEAKLLYSILKDRFDLSVKNNWIDEEGNIYFIFTVEEIGEMMGCGKDKVIKLKKELKKYDLLEEVRQGLNKPNLIYLGSLESETAAKPLSEAEVGKSEFRKSENPNSRNRKNRIQEVGKSESNDTDISETKYSDTDLIISEEEEERLAAPEKKKQDSLTRKVEKPSRYDKDYIWQLVYEQLVTDQYKRTTIDFILMNFEARYQLALKEMRFARSAEMIAEYVYNGLLAEWNKKVREHDQNAVG